MASKKNLRPGENILHLLFIVQECLVNFPHCLNGIFDVWIIPNILQKSAKGGVFHLPHHFPLILHQFLRTLFLKWEKVHNWLEFVLSRILLSTYCKETNQMERTWLQIFTKVWIALSATLCCRQHFCDRWSPFQELALMVFHQWIKLKFSPNCHPIRFSMDELGTAIQLWKYSSVQRSRTIGSKNPNIANQKQHAAPYWHLLIPTVVVNEDSLVVANQMNAHLLMPKAQIEACFSLQASVLTLMTSLKSKCNNSNCCRGHTVLEVHGVKCGCVSHKTHAGILGSSDCWVSSTNHGQNANDRTSSCILHDYICNSTSSLIMWQWKMSNVTLM